MLSDEELDALLRRIEMTEYRRLLCAEVLKDLSTEALEKIIREQRQLEIALLISIARHW